MAYIVNRYNGTQLVVVEDGTIDSTTDLKFVGRNYSGYGEVQNENYLHLLENFSGTSAPSKALDGQVWYDASTTKLKFYTGAAWKTAGGTEVAATEPAGLDEGDLWWSSTSNQLYGKTAAGEFVLVGPQAAGSGTTQMLSVKVLDNTEAEKSIIVALINDRPIYVISNEEFTLATNQPDGVPADLEDATQFSKIKRGITMVNSVGGLTLNNEGDYISASNQEPIIWGTANDALRLGGTIYTDYLKRTDTITFGDSGLTIGDSNDLLISIVSGNQGSIKNTVGDYVYLGAKRGGSGAADNIISIRNVDASNTGIFPETNNTYNIGNASEKFAEIHATSFKGTADKATTVDVAGTGRSASTAAGANTIAARDANGDLTARFFNGTAIKAQYADLAEKYTTEETHPVGTIMAVSSERFVEEKDVSAETRPAKSSDLVIGVISEKPAYLMNADINGQPIALKGRVPVRCSGPIQKGQAIYAWDNGVGGHTATRALVGIALESNPNPEEKLVECVLKV